MSGSLFYGCIFLGSALGGVARFLLSACIGRLLKETFPWGTLVVNITGALMIGILLGMLGKGILTMEGISLGAVTALGFLGGYTTFSTLSLQTLYLTQEVGLKQAGGYVLLSLILGLTAVFTGYGMGVVLL